MMKRSFILLAVFAVCCLSACDLYKDVPFYNENEAPIINGIADAVGNESIDSITIGQLIKVGGHSFNMVEKVRINDTEVPLGKITRLRDGLYFAMPRIPRSVENNLILESKFGEILYPIKVKFPPFGITGILNEYTPRGQELIILGSSMDLYATVGVSKVSFSNSESGDSAVSTVTFVSENEIRVMVPDSAPDKATVTFYSVETGNRVCPVKYRDCEFLIENLETGRPATRYPEWVVPNATYPLPLNPLPTEGEKYSHINKIATVSGTTLNFVGNYNLTIPAIYYDNGETYDLKFELFTVQPIKYRIAVSVNWGTTWVPFGPATQSTDSSLWLTTNGKWQTFSIPMATWKNKTGEKKLRLWNTLPANVLYDVCFDNFRIQRK